MLFGVDRAGVLYAFDTDGVLQPVLLDGVSSIQTAAAANIEGSLWNGGKSLEYYPKPWGRYRPWYQLHLRPDTISPYSGGGQFTLRIWIDWEY